MSAALQPLPPRLTGAVVADALAARQRGRAGLGELELGELLRAARLAVACGGTAGLARRERLLGQLSHARPVRRAQARRLARALGAAAGLAAADLAAGLAPAVGPLPPAVLPGRLLAARAALRPAGRLLALAPTGRPARAARLGGPAAAVRGVRR